MSRPLCDPIDIPRVLSELAQGLTPLQVYREYAAVAARPYSRRSFEDILAYAKKTGSLIPGASVRITAKPHVLRPAQDESLAAQAAASDTHWLPYLQVKPSNVVTLTDDGPHLWVRGDALHIRDDDQVLIYERRSTKPLAIVLTGWGGTISIGAMRFCTDHGVAVVVLDWGRDLMTVVSTPAPRSEKLIRMQCTADVLSISKSIVRRKVEAHVDVGAIPHHIGSYWIDRLSLASNLTMVTAVEASAAKLAWLERPIMIRWRELGKVPRSWKLPYSTRRSGLNAKSAYKARDPINSLLNLALAVTAGRLTVALVAHGLSPSVGLMHRSPRWPLTYDAIEPLRPYVEKAVFDFIECTPLSPSDFIVENGTHAVKTRGPFSKVYLDAVALRQSAIDGAVAYIIDLLRRP